MKLKVCQVILGMAVAAIGLFGAVPPVMAAKVNDKACSEISDETLRSAMGCDNSDKTVQPIAVNMINVVIATVGIIAVVVIVVSGVRLATSSGDAAKVTQAKRMIIYALAGLGVAVFAWVIVSFVLNNFAGG